MPIGLKIAKDNQNVKTASSPDLVLDSQLQTVPIALQGTIERVASTDFNFTIKHGLGFVPFFITSYKTSEFPTYWSWSPTIVPFLGSPSGYVLGHRVDTENLIVRVTIAAANTTMTVRYIIFNFPIALSI